MSPAGDGHAIKPEPPHDRAGPVPIRRVMPTSTELPCGKCIHAPICAIKAMIDEIPVELRVPQLGGQAEAALTVTATVKIECSFFHRASGPRGPYKARRPA